MNIIIIYHSHSGKTKQVAEKIQKSLSGDSIEVTPQHPYSSVMVYPKGCYRAMKGEIDDVTPESIDVSGYDLVVMASPVWAGKPTPVINGAIRALSGCSDKQAFLVLTCGVEKSGQEAVPFFRKRVEEKGLLCAGEAVLDKKQVDDTGAIEELISSIRSVSEKP